MLRQGERRMARKKAAPELAVYQFKVKLKGIRPPIWRRFQVTNKITLYELHQVLQTVMGWENCHPYQFTIQGTYFCDPDSCCTSRDVDASKVKLWQVLTEPKKKLLYQYDFGDDWRHEVVLEKILPPAEGVQYPVCLAGARACPPEDCGGDWEYQALLAAISDPAHERYGEAVEWLGKSFDPEAFDLEQVNQWLGGPTAK